MGGQLRFALAELATLPRAAVVVEDRYSQIFAQALVRPALVADVCAELAVRWPSVPVISCENRKLAQEWTYRFLAAAQSWAADEAATAARIGSATTGAIAVAPVAPEPRTAEVRAWAVTQGLDVPDRGRLRAEVHAAWRTAHDGE